MAQQAVTPQQQMIWQTVAAIPRGRVATYGQVAAMAGLPGAARQVGTALKKLPPGSTVPWHRVVNAQGKISLPTGSRGFKEQQARLQQEGVVIAAGKLDLRATQWQP